MPADITGVHEQAIRLHDTRKLLEQAQERLRAAEVVLELTSEYQNVTGIKAHIKSLATDVQAEDELLRMKTLSGYRETGIAKPVSGVEVKQIELVVIDEVVAIPWCKVNLPALVREVLDPNFAKAARNIPGAPIKITYEPRVYVAKDLSKAVTE